MFQHSDNKLKEQRGKAEQQLSKFLSNFSIEDSEVGIDDATYQAHKSRLERAQSQRSYQALEAAGADGTPHKASEQEPSYFAILDAKKAQLERICRANGANSDSDEGLGSIASRKPVRNTFAHKMQSSGETPGNNNNDRPSTAKHGRKPNRSDFDNQKRIDFSSSEVNASPAEPKPTKSSAKVSKQRVKKSGKAPTRDELVDQWNMPSNEGPYKCTVDKDRKRGLGMITIQDGKYIRVAKVVPGGCADRAGVSDGEVLLKANSTGLYKATKEQADTILDANGSVTFEIVPMDIPLPPHAEELLYSDELQAGNASTTATSVTADSDTDFDLGSDDNATEAASLQTVDLELLQSNAPPPPTRDTPTPPPRDASSDDFVSSDSSDAHAIEDVQGSADHEHGPISEPANLLPLGEPANLQPMSAAANSQDANSQDNVGDAGVVTLEPLSQPLRRSSVTSFHAGSTVSEMSSQQSIVSMPDELAAADMYDLSPDSNSSDDSLDLSED